MNKRRRRPIRPSHIVIHALLIGGSIVMLLPFVWMISTSLKGPDEILTDSIDIIPNDIRWENYSEAWTAQPFGRYFLNTIFIAVVTVIIELLFASMAAYAFAFFQFPFKSAIFYIFLGTMMIPQQALLVPDYVILSKLRWIDSYFALIVPFCTSVYAIFLLRQFFMTLPRDLYDAAVVDGCSKLRFYFSVLLPLSIGPMVTIGIFSFLGSWNSFIWPLVVTNSEHLRVLQVGLAYFLQESGTEWGLLMAASTFTTVPWSSATSSPSADLPKQLPSPG